MHDTGHKRSPTHPLAGVTVLIPRDGDWGQRASEALASQGAASVIAPLIRTIPTAAPEKLASACDSLSQGSFDWLAVTSAVTANVLGQNQVVLPPGTKIMAVGQATREALERLGYRVAYAPVGVSHSQRMVEQWRQMISGPQRVLVLQSNISDSGLPGVLAELAHTVTTVEAYQTIGVALADDVRKRLLNGHIDAVLVTSGSVARQLADELGGAETRVALVCVGERTAARVADLGLRAAAVAEQQSIAGLVQATVTLFAASG